MEEKVTGIREEYIEEYIVLSAKHKTTNMESLFYGVFVIGFIYLGYRFIQGLASYLSATFNEISFPTVYLILWLMDIFLLIFVSAITIRRHLLVSNISVYVRQNGFNEIEIPIKDIISVEAKKDSVIINTLSHNYNYSSCANGEAIAKQIMALKQNNEEEK